MVVLSIYIRTLSHSIAGGDSGEIVAEGCKVFSEIVLVISSFLVCYTSGQVGHCSPARISVNYTNYLRNFWNSKCNGEHIA